MPCRVTGIGIIKYCVLGDLMAMHIWCITNVIVQLLRMNGIGMKKMMFLDRLIQ